MNKTVLMLALVSLLSLGLVVSRSSAAGTTGKSGFMMFDSSDLIGAPAKDSHGEPMGVVDEIRVDSGGHAFARVIHWGYDLYLYGEGGVNGLTPFEELRISHIKAGQVTGDLRPDMEHLDFIPYLNPPKADSLQYRANTHEYYYGIQPYWTQGGSARKSGLMELNSLNLVGASVKNSHGKLLGIVNEILVDSDGHAFAVINHGDYDLYGESGVNTPVPLEALRISQIKPGKESVVLNIDREHLDFAPFLDPTKTNNRQYEASIYEYYGLRPYWTENGAKR